MNPTDALLAAGATARLTRLVVADDIGAWWIKDPIYAAARRALALDEITKSTTVVDPNGPFDTTPGWVKYVSGLECPHCVGYWAGVLVLGSHAVARRRPGTLRAWRFVTATLALNTAVTVAGGAVDYFAGGDDE